MYSILITRLALSSSKPKLWKSKHLAPNIARLLYAEHKLIDTTQRQRHTKVRRKPSKTIHVCVGDKLHRLEPKRNYVNKDNYAHQPNKTCTKNDQINIHPCAKLEQFTRKRDRKNKKKNYDEKIFGKLWKAAADILMTAVHDSKMQQIDGCKLLIKLNEKLEMLEYNEAVDCSFAGRTKSKSSRTVLNKAFKKGLEHLMKQKRFAREKIINRFIFPDIVTQEPYCISIYPSTSFSDNEDKLFTINIVGSNDDNKATPSSSTSGSLNETNEYKELESEKPPKKKLDDVKEKAQKIELTDSTFDKYDEENIEEFDYFQVEPDLGEKKYAFMSTESEELQALYQLKDIVENNLKELNACEAKLEEVEHLLNTDDDEQLEYLQPENEVHEYHRAKQDLMRRSKNAIQSSMIYDEIEQQQLGEVRMAGTLRERVMNLWQYSVDGTATDLNNFNKTNDFMQPLEVEYNDGVKMETEDLQTAKNVENSEEKMQSKEQDENSLSDMVLSLEEVTAIDAEEETTQKLENISDTEKEICAAKQNPDDDYSEPTKKTVNLKDVTQLAPVDFFGIVTEVSEMVMQSKKAVKFENVSHQKIDPFETKDALISEENATQQKPVNLLEIVADHSLSEMVKKAEVSLNSEDMTQDKNENIENSESQLKEENSINEIVMESDSSNKSDNTAKQKPKNFGENKAEVNASSLDEIVLNSESEIESEEAMLQNELNLTENNKEEFNTITKMDAIQPKSVDLFKNVKTDVSGSKQDDINTLSGIVIKSETEVKAEAEAMLQKEVNLMENNMNNTRSKLEEHNLITKIDGSTKSDEKTLEKPLNLCENMTEINVKADHTIEEKLENLTENSMDNARVKIDEHNMVIKMDNSKKLVNLSENIIDSEKKVEQSFQLEDENLSENNMDKIEPKLEKQNMFMETDKSTKSEEGTQKKLTDSEVKAKLTIEEKNNIEADLEEHNMVSKMNLSLILNNENTSEIRAAKQNPSISLSEKLELLQSEENDKDHSKTNEMKNKYMKTFSEVEFEIKAEQKQENILKNSIETNEINLEEHNTIIKGDSPAKSDDATLQITHIPENINEIGVSKLNTENSCAEADKESVSKEALIKTFGSTNSDETIQQKSMNLADNITEKNVHGMQDTGNSPIVTISPLESKVKAEHAMQPEQINFTGTNMANTITKKEQLNIVVNKTDNLKKSDISAQQKVIKLSENINEIRESEQNILTEQLKPEECNIFKTETKLKMDDSTKSDETAQQIPVNLSLNLTEIRGSEMKARQAVELKQENNSEISSIKSGETTPEKQINLFENITQTSGSEMKAEHVVELKKENISENASIKSDDMTQQKPINLFENITHISGSEMKAEHVVELKQESISEITSIKSDNTTQQNPINLSENIKQTIGSEMKAGQFVELKQVTLAENSVDNNKTKLEEQNMVKKTESPLKAVNLSENIEGIDASPLDSEVKAKNAVQTEVENLNKNTPNLEEIKYVIELVRETGSSENAACEKNEKTEAQLKVHKIQAIIKNSTLEDTQKQTETQANQSISNDIQEDKVFLQQKQNTGITIKTDEELVKEIAAKRILRFADVDKSMLETSEIQNTGDLSVTASKPTTMMQTPSKENLPIKRKKVRFASTKSIEIKSGQSCIPEKKKYESLEKDDSIKISGGTPYGDAPKKRKRSTLKGAISDDALSHIQLQGGSKKKPDDDDGIIIEGGTTIPPKKKVVDAVPEVKIFGGSECKCPPNEPTTAHFEHETEIEVNNEPVGLLGRMKRLVKFFYSDDDGDASTENKKSKPVK